MYIEANQLEVGVMTRGMSWFDMGTIESLDDTTEFIGVLQNRQSNMIGCIKEIALIHNFIEEDKLNEPLLNMAKANMVNISKI